MKKLLTILSIFAVAFVAFYFITFYPPTIEQIEKSHIQLTNK